ncbi:MAG: hypothetical protein RIQ79_2157 [Verrucomicrobiota bacterium]
MQIVGATNLSEEEIALKITEGHRLVSYPFCVSILILTFRRSSDVYLLKPGENGRSLAFGYGAISFLLGWWGIPWGPIYTVVSISECISGGKDHSQAFLNGVLGAFDPAAGAAPPPLPGTSTGTAPLQNTPAAAPASAIEKNPGLAIASLCLGIAGIFPLGIFGAVPAIFCGHIALSHLKRNQGTKGKRPAAAGLTLGYLVVAFYVVMIAVVILDHGSGSPS